MRISFVVAGLGCLLAEPLSVRAGFIEFTARTEWEAAVGAFTTIGFTGFPDGTFITDQYAELGVLFLDGDDNTFHSGIFLNDDWGLDGNASIHLLFDEPMAYIGVDFPGTMQMQLYNAGQLILTSSEFGGSGTGFFAGVLSSQLFDEVVINDWAGTEVSIDDLHFGPPIPAPCPADLDGSGSVDLLDLLQVLMAWGACPPPPGSCDADLNGDASVDVLDLLGLLTSWGPC